MVNTRDNIAKVNELAMEIKPSLHFTLRFLRKRHNLTQDALAQELGVSRRQVIAWEMGHSEPSRENVVKLAEYFDCEIDYFDLTAEKTAEKAKQILAEQVEHWSELPIESLSTQQLSVLIRIVKLLQPNALVEEKITLHEKVDDNRELEVALSKTTQVLNNDRPKTTG